MTIDDKPSPALAFNGTLIRDRDEMLNLTDMWKASGSDASKRPVIWLRQEATQEFVSWIADNLKITEVTQDHFGLVVTKKGGSDGGGATWGHWQVAMAYAKYLSPEFHVWCNTIVRDYMSGRATKPMAMQGALETMLEATIERVITRMLPAMVEQRVATDTRAVVAGFVGVREILDEMGAVSKGRDSLNRRVGVRMLEAAEAEKVDHLRCLHTNRHLFPAVWARRWATSTITAEVAAHNAAATGQMALSFTRRKGVRRAAVEGVEQMQNGPGVLRLGGKNVYFDTGDHQLHDGDRAIVLRSDGSLTVDTLCDSQYGRPRWAVTGKPRDGLVVDPVPMAGKIASWSIITIIGKVLAREPQ